MDIIDIYSKNPYPADELSNFFPHEFTIDGVRCASMEGFLQSLKYKSVKAQIKICGLAGHAAKKKGARKFLWKLTGKLHWNGKSFSRFGNEYSQLLDKAYAALSRNERFTRALKSSDGCALAHTSGKTDPKKTVLTIDEFLSRLERIRKQT